MTVGQRVVPPVDPSNAISPERLIPLRLEPVLCQYGPPGSLVPGCRYHGSRAPAIRGHRPGDPWHGVGNPRLRLARRCQRAGRAHVTSTAFRTRTAIRSVRATSRIPHHRPHRGPSRLVTATVPFAATAPEEQSTRTTAVADAHAVRPASFLAGYRVGHGNSTPAAACPRVAVGTRPPRPTCGRPGLSSPLSSHRSVSQCALAGCARLLARVARPQEVLT